MKSRINLSELKAGVRNLNAGEMQGIHGGRTGGVLTAAATALCNKIKKPKLRALCLAAVKILL